MITNEKERGITIIATSNDIDMAIPIQTPTNINPFGSEPFIIRNLPRFEDPFIPKHIDSSPWWSKFDNKRKFKLNKSKR